MPKLTYFRSEKPQNFDKFCGILKPRRGNGTARMSLCGTQAPGQCAFSVPSGSHAIVPPGLLLGLKLLPPGSFGGGSSVFPEFTEFLTEQGLFRRPNQFCKDGAERFGERMSPSFLLCMALPCGEIAVPLLPFVSLVVLAVCLIVIRNPQFAAPSRWGLRGVKFYLSKKGRPHPIFLRKVNVP